MLLLKNITNLPPEDCLRYNCYTTRGNMEPKTAQENAQCPSKLFS